MNGKDRTGQRFGRLTAIRRVENDKWNNAKWLCRCDCGKEKIVPTTGLSTGKTSSCGCLKSDAKIGNKNPMWDGGRTEVNGYIQIKDPSHPRSNNQGYVFEHTLVMEKIIGRPLIRAEVVHHCNGIRADNRPDNLRLFQSNGDHMAHHHSESRCLGMR
jgi:hypothetical protein